MFFLALFWLNFWFPEDRGNDRGPQLEPEVAAAIRRNRLRVRT